MKKLAVRTLISLVGIIIISLSAAIFYLVNLGADPYQVFTIGLHKVLKISYGHANMLSNGVILVLLIIFNRKYVKAALFMATFFIGTFLDFFVWLLDDYITASTAFPVRMLFIVICCPLLALGIYVYLLPNLGASPADSVGLIITDITKIHYKHVRIFTDVTYTLAGLLLGGTIGITTAVTAMFTGPLIGLYGKYLAKTDVVIKIKRLYESD